MKKVLVVDDSDTLRKEVSGALEVAGFEVLQAANGSQGLAQVHTNDLSVILLDVNMPGLSGLDVLERLKSKRTLSGKRGDRARQLFCLPSLQLFEMWRRR